MDQEADMRLLAADDTLKELDLKSQTIRFTSNFVLPIKTATSEEVSKKMMMALRTKVKLKVCIIRAVLSPPG